jgi:choline dehydrogenase-like flavoprotein
MPIAWAPRVHAYTHTHTHTHAPGPTLCTLSSSLSAHASREGSGVIQDASDLEPGARIESTVCIIGGGAAGITAALRLARAGVDVVMLEAGGASFESASQAHYEAENVGLAYQPASTRVRQLGGSTNHWGGMCRPLDPWDFEAHGWVSDSGWPITREQLLPFYREAQNVLDLSDFDYRFANHEVDVERYPPLLGPDNTAFDPALWQQSFDFKMAARYRDALEDDARIRCILHAQVTQLVPRRDGNHVEFAAVRGPGERDFEVRARHFVLAAGGIENPRLLLLSDSVTPGGLGNGHDLVGRYFMDHPNQTVAWMFVKPTPDALAFQEEYLQRNVRIYPGQRFNIVGFRASDARKQEKGLLGYAVHIARHVHPLEKLDEEAREEIEAILSDPLKAWLAESRVRPIRRYNLRCIAEQSPNRNSRISLSHERDGLGLRKAKVDWRLREADLASIEAHTRRFGIELARTGHGRIKMQEIPALNWMPAGTGGHHLGTTRMSDDPRSGVTDRDGGVHGIDNLSIAGGSLFPTGGYANPTLTIVALTLRLVDHLVKKKELRG